jgi:hypothetical protein
MLPTCAGTRRPDNEEAPMPTPTAKPQSAKPQPRPGTAARTGPGDILAHFLPHRVLRDARQLAVSFQNEDLFRDHVRDRLAYVGAVVLVFVLVSTVCAVAVMLSVPRLASPPVGFGLKFLAFLAGVAVWMAGILAQLYLFFGWVQERALEKAGKLPHHQFKLDRIGVEFLLKKPRIVVPGAIIVVCIVAPLAIVALHAPAVALALFAAGAGAPARYARVDR